MPGFSAASEAKLKTCCPELQAIFAKVIEHWDCTVFYGFRGQAEQAAAVAAGHSTLAWGQSKHNTLPSEAVDVGPYYPEVPQGGIDWRTDAELLIAAQAGDFEALKAILENIKRWHEFVGFVRGIAAAQGYRLRCGADWDGDQRFNDQSLIDLPHFEIVR